MRSADFQSTVSPICNRQSRGFPFAVKNCGRLAEWNSAIQQIANLRYVEGRTDHAVARFFSRTTDFAPLVSGSPDWGLSHCFNGS